MFSAGKNSGGEAHRPPVVTALVSAQIGEHKKDLGVCAKVLGWGYGVQVTVPSVNW